MRNCKLFVIRKKILILILIIIFLSLTYVYKSYMGTKNYKLIYSGDIIEKKVAFTFESVWEEGVTEQILQILKDHNIKSTFFLSGEWIKKNPDLAFKLLAFRHEIGNHTHSHINLTRLTKEQVIFEIKHFEEIAYDVLLGYKANLFRPPFGEHDLFVLKIAAMEGYQTVLWGINSRDLIAKTPGEIIKHVLNHIYPGAVILFHTSDGVAINALPTLIRSLEMRGYTIVPVSELLSSP